MLLSESNGVLQRRAAREQAVPRAEVPRPRTAPRRPTASEPRLAPVPCARVFRDGLGTEALCSRAARRCNTPGTRQQHADRTGRGRQLPGHPAAGARRRPAELLPRSAWLNRSRLPGGPPPLSRRPRSVGVRRLDHRGLTLLPITSRSCHRSLALLPARFRSPSRRPRARDGVAERETAPAIVPGDDATNQRAWRSARATIPTTAPRVRRERGNRIRVPQRWDEPPGPIRSTPDSAWYRTRFSCPPEPLENRTPKPVR